MMGLVVALLVTVGVSVTTAQTAVCEVACEIAQGQAFTVFTEADATVTNYAVFVNGTRSLQAGRVASGLIEFAFPAGLTRGTYAFTIQASDAQGVVWVSESNTLTVKPGQRRTKFRG